MFCAVREAVISRHNGGAVERLPQTPRYNISVMSDCPMMPRGTRNVCLVAVRVLKSGSIENEKDFFSGSIENFIANCDDMSLAKSGISTQRTRFRKKYDNYFSVA